MKNKGLYILFIFVLCFGFAGNVKAETFTVQFKYGESPGFGISPPTSEPCSFNIVNKKMTNFDNSCYIESKNSGDYSKGKVILDTRDVEITEESKCYTLDYVCKKEKQEDTYVYKLSDFKLIPNSSTKSDAANAIICPNQPLIDVKGCRDLNEANYKVKCPGLANKSYEDVKTTCENITLQDWENACNGNVNQEDVDNLIQSIKERAANDSGKNGDPDYGLDETISCSKLLGEGDNSLGSILKNVFFVICVIGVILLIFTMSGDFLKAITSEEADAMADAFKKAKTRIIATIILLLLPVVVNFIIDVVNNSVYESNGEIKIGNISDCKIIN